MLRLFETFIVGRTADYSYHMFCCKFVVHGSLIL